MKNNWLLVCLCVLLVQFGFAQENDLQIQGVTPNLYLAHTVQAKENWYSIGRIYNISPKQLAPYNALSLNKALAIGQTIKIPLTAENFSQDGKKANDEVFVPVHHIIQEKEWLYRVSVNYNKVPVENLEKWNNINKDQAKAGLSLVVGYLKVKAGQSVLATQGETRTVNTNTNPVAVNAPSEKQPGTTEQKKTVSPPPAVDNVDQAAVKNNTTRTETKPGVTTPVTGNPPVSNPVIATSNPSADYKASYFKGQYDESGKSISGNAGIFKSTSGWSDGKYYALVNNVPVGTIVKVNNPVSGKTIFAKVLGNLPDMKESLGLIARLSDAAAAQIEGTGVKFSVEVRY